MAFDDSHHRTAQQQNQDRLDATAKNRLVDTYREPFLAAIPPCPACGQPMQWEMIDEERHYACFRRECPDSVHYKA